MAELIPISEISELKPASEVKEVADAAIDIQEQNAVARAINLAANTGEHRIVWVHNISDKLKETLEDKGYTVKPNPRSADLSKEWIISGF